MRALGFIFFGITDRLESMEQFIKNLAKGAGAILRDGFRKKMQVSVKSSKYDWVTEYDVKTENFIIEKLRKKFPNHGIIGEENGDQTRKKKNFWIIDPLDGTHAFVKGMPQFATTFSFVSNNVLRYGVVYDPIGDELFFARKGKGATLNSRKISVSNLDDLYYSNLGSYVASSLFNKGGEKLRKYIYEKIVFKHHMWTDRTSSVALALGYQAAGRFDTILSKGLNPWDISAGGLIVREAGGKVTDFRGRTYRWNMDEMISANPALHKPVLKILKKYA